MQMQKQIPFGDDNKKSKVQMQMSWVDGCDAGHYARGVRVLPMTVSV